MSLKSKIIEKSNQLGFVQTGFAEIRELDLETQYLKFATEQGYLADNQYLLRNIELLKNPKLIIPNANTMIVTAYNYYTDYHHSEQINKGKISRYGWGQDYHLILKPKMDELSDYIKQLEPTAENFVSFDGGKVLEKRWAEYSGIGWQGNNTIVINKKYGSWIFIGVIITSLNLEPDAPHKDLCGDCRICMDKCPTKAIIAPKKIDSRKCITYLTLEDKNKLFANTDLDYQGFIYGCDICQQVCPWNKFPIQTEDNNFNPNDNQTEIDIELVNNMTEDEFASRFKNSPIKRIKLKGLQANAKILTISNNKNLSK